MNYFINFQILLTYRSYTSPGKYLEEHSEWLNGLGWEYPCRSMDGYVCQT